MIGDMGRERYEPQDLPEEEFERVDPSDLFSPPVEPCECFCLHCGHTFMSDGIWLQRVRGAPDGFAGFWMCPTPNCGGKGFTFDIFPTDPIHPANANWNDFDDDDDEVLEAESDPLPFDPFDPTDPASADALPPLDPSADDAEINLDLEGEEWKYGLPPDESYLQHQTSLPTDHLPPGPADEPDYRPREIDWSDPDDQPGDIPF